jgi:hypothetical protein
MLNGAQVNPSTFTFPKILLSQVPSELSFLSLTSKFRRHRQDVEAAFQVRVRWKYSLW